MTMITLENLNENDDLKKHGKMIAADGQGNELWSFGEKHANRFEVNYGDPDCDGVWWDNDVESWNIPAEYALQ